jgi:hypothetical protein
MRLEKQLSKLILDVRTIVEEIPHMGGATLNTKKRTFGPTNLGICRTSYQSNDLDCRKLITQENWPWNRFYKGQF